jgi:hemerythrin-like domain-containing protein
VDLYSNIHKGQRKTLFEIAIQAGKADYHDPACLDQLIQELIAFKDEMRLHAQLEENHIHPLLCDRVPEGATKLEEDHRQMHKTLDELEQHLTSLHAKPADFEKTAAVTLEFYRAWNRFIAFYLEHIDTEEEHVQPLLWILCTNTELLTAFQRIMADQKPKELMDNLTMMIPAMNVNELVDMLEQGRATTPPETYHAGLALTEQVLPPDEWTVLKGKIKLASGKVNS